MTQTFKVGDTVSLSTLRGTKATVEYGPFDDRDVYVVRLVDEPEGDEVRTFTARSHVMSLASTFAPGDKAIGTASGRTHEILAGPFRRSCGDEWYVTRVEGADHEMASDAGCLKPLPADDSVKTGDRVRVLYAWGAARTHGRTGVVTSVTNTFREEDGDRHRFHVDLGDGTSVYARDVEKVSDGPVASPDTYTYNGITYDLTARYQDTDGDTWTFRRFGDRVKGGMDDVPEDADDGTSLGFVVRNYGPLTRVND